MTFDLTIILRPTANSCTHQAAYQKSSGSDFQVWLCQLGLSIFFRYVISYQSLQIQKILRTESCFIMHLQAQFCLMDRHKALHHLVSLQNINIFADEGAALHFTGWYAGHDI